MALTHGTLRGYSHYKCRCDECRHLWNERNRRFKKSPEQRAKQCAYQKKYHAARSAIDPEYVLKVKAKKKASGAKRMADPAVRERKRDLSRRIQAARRLEIAKIKVERGCADCGFNKHPSALDFDHVAGGKVDGVSRLVNWSWQKVVEEIAKCEVVCANCHRIRTATRVGKPT